jgi:hypothetical protein
MYVNLTKNVAEKLGEQGSYGYYDNISTPVNNEQIDGGNLLLVLVLHLYSKTVAAPLLCALSQSEKAIPLFLT